MDIAHIPPRVAAVIRDVAAEHKIDVEKLMRRSRRRPITQARQDAMRRIRAMPWAAKWGNGRPSFPLIGYWFNCHHTTVMHACYTARVYSQKTVEVPPKCIDPDAKRESMAA